MNKELMTAGSCLIHLTEGSVKILTLSMKFTVDSFSQKEILFLLIFYSSILLGIKKKKKNKQTMTWY